MSKDHFTLKLCMGETSPFSVTYHFLRPVGVSKEVFVSLWPTVFHSYWILSTVHLPKFPKETLGNKKILDVRLVSWPMLKGI